MSIPMVEKVQVLQSTALFLGGGGLFVCTPSLHFQRHDFKTWCHVKKCFK